MFGGGFFALKNKWHEAFLGTFNFSYLGGAKSAPEVL